MCVKYNYKDQPNSGSNDQLNTAYKERLSLLSQVHQPSNIILYARSGGGKEGGYSRVVGLFPIPGVEPIGLALVK